MTTSRKKKGKHGKVTFYIGNMEEGSTFRQQIGNGSPSIQKKKGKKISAGKKHTKQQLREISINFKVLTEFPTY